MIEYIIKAKIDSLVSATVCAFLGLQENIVEVCNIECIYILIIYGLSGLIVMELLKLLVRRFNF